MAKPNTDSPSRQKISRLIWIEPVFSRQPDAMPSHGIFFACHTANLPELKFSAHCEIFHPDDLLPFPTQSVTLENLPGIARIDQLLHHSFFIYPGRCTPMANLSNIEAHRKPPHNPFPTNQIPQPSKFAALEIRQQPFQNSARQFIATKQQQTCQYCNPPSTATQSISSQSHSPTQQVCRP